MLFPDLANSTSATIRADLTAAGIAISSATETYLAALEARTQCWKSVFAASATWLGTASAQEQAIAWQSIIKICNHDGRPLAAMSRLFYFQSNASALKTLWQALPSDALLELRVALAANPLLYTMFSDPTSGVTGLPGMLSSPVEAAAVWKRVHHKLGKLSRFENPHSV
jgi:hypothetical protein